MKKKFNEREDIQMGKSVGSYFWRKKNFADYKI